MGLFRRNKNNNNPLLRQIIGLVPRWILESYIKKYKVTKFAVNTTQLAFVYQCLTGQSRTAKGGIKIHTCFDDA